MFYQGPPPPTFYPTYPLYPPNPIVIGEGEVTTQVSPDGSMQYFFLPTAARLPPDVNFNRCRSCCPCLCSTSNTGAWFIKSIQGVQPIYNQPYQQPFFPAPSQPYNIDFKIQPSELKFHNDGWTSTTDLHYFFPSLRRREWVPKVGAQTQVEIPFQRSCRCIIPLKKSKEDSNMSIDEDKECDCGCSS